MEIAQHANYPFARQTTKGLIQSTDKFAHSKNAGCLSQSRRKLQQRMVASEMAIYASPSDQFNSRSNRTMTGRCGGWTRMRRDENMPISLKTQVDRTAKTPVTARHARVGGLCGFRSSAERVPAGSPKTGRCTAVRHKNSTEAQRSGFGRKRRCSGMDETCRLRRGEGYGACIDEAAKQEKRLGAFLRQPVHICPQCGQFRGVEMALFCGYQKQNDAVIS